MGQCVLCKRRLTYISSALQLCAPCILADAAATREQAAAVHARARGEFGLPARPPRTAEGLGCRLCTNACDIEEGQIGYCGVRRNDRGQLVGGDAQCGAVQWYHDPLPTNCVADWVCPASGPAGYDTFTDTEGPERGYFNLAVFYEACSFDCLFCQNWHYKDHSIEGPRHSSDEVAAAVNPRTRCICFFGGDPSCQVEHALSAAHLARKQRGGRILRVCWETNGSVCRRALEDMAAVSLESGGCIKFDLKAWDDSLHQALCGASNRRTLENFEHVSDWIVRRRAPPLLAASTLLVPGYIDAEQVGRIAQFIAQLDPSIPYALLAFRGSFEMADLPTTSRREATDCLAAAEAAGLTRVRIGNVHLLT
ncbi:MAG TPA: radical SAM protein [Candidatus Hydrogenedentes bacterium]|nr:radical SAM protein [Candidatus Hydrogenedentota bacterium]HIJ74928.1 radical SAM protein [Candidatus Hydrogenedentota bacterium]